VDKQASGVAKLAGSAVDLVGPEAEGGAAKLSTAAADGPATSGPARRTMTKEEPFAHHGPRQDHPGREATARPTRNQSPTVPAASGHARARLSRPDVRLEDAL